MSDPEYSTAELTWLREEGKDALAAIFMKHQDQLRVTIRFRIDVRLLGRVDIEDILQETYLAAAQRLDHFLADPSVSCLVWLRQVALQVLVDVHRHHLRAKKRNVTAEVRGQSYPNATSGSIAARLVASGSTPSNIMTKAETLTQLQAAFEALEVTDREVLALRHFEGLGNNEVAEILGLKKSAATNRYMRALGRLRKIVSDLESERDAFGTPS